MYSYSFLAWEETFLISPSGFSWLDENNSPSESIRKIQLFDQFSCEDQCVQTPTCVGFTFWKDKNQCDLKNEFQAFRNLTSKGSEISGLFYIKKICLLLRQVLNHKSKNVITFSSQVDCKPLDLFTRMIQT